LAQPSSTTQRADSFLFTAVALQPNQLAWRCLTRGTVHSDVAATSAVLQRSRVPANCQGRRGTVHGCSVGKDVYAATCVVKHFRSWSICVGTPSAITTSAQTGPQTNL